MQNMLRMPVRQLQNNSRSVPWVWSFPFPWNDAVHVVVLSLTFINRKWPPVTVESLSFTINHLMSFYVKIALCVSDKNPVPYESHRCVEVGYAPEVTAFYMKWNIAKSIDDLVVENVNI